MKFLVISQRAIANPDYRLTDLTGHGRFDVLVRCILASSKSILELGGSDVYAFMKVDNTGYLEWRDHEEINKEDEISMAAMLQDNWGTYFHPGSLADLLGKLAPQQIIMLDEQGEDIHSLADIASLLGNALIILGAQSDLVDEDLRVIGSLDSDVKYVSLSSQAMLASQAITFIRQIYLVSQV